MSVKAEDVLANRDLEGVLTVLLEGYMTFFQWGADGPRFDRLPSHVRKEVWEKVSKTQTFNGEYSLDQDRYKELIFKYANLMSALPEDYQGNRKDILQILEQPSGEPTFQDSAKHWTDLIKGINKKCLQKETAYTLVKLVQQLAIKKEDSPPPPELAERPLPVQSVKEEVRDELLFSYGTNVNVSSTPVSSNNTVAEEEHSLPTVKKESETIKTDGLHRQ